MGQSRLVKVEGLPITATFEDIRKLAREAAPPDGDKHIEDSTLVEARKNVRNTDIYI